MTLNLGSFVFLYELNALSHESSAQFFSVPGPPSALDITVFEKASNSTSKYLSIGDAAPISINALRTVTTKIDHIYRIICRSSGSRPKASLVWMINGAPVEDATLVDLNPSSSEVSNRISPQVTDESDTFSDAAYLFSPKIEDDEKLFTCRAFNGILQDSIMEDSIRIKVNCKFINYSMLRIMSGYSLIKTKFSQLYMMYTIFKFILMLQREAIFLIINQLLQVPYIFKPNSSNGIKY